MQAVKFRKNFAKSDRLPLSLILLLNEAKSVPLPQGERVILNRNQIRRVCVNTPKTTSTGAKK